VEEHFHAIEAGLLCLGGQRRNTERKKYQYGVTPVHLIPPDRCAAASAGREPG